ncbi:MAG: hypothetical protein AB1Z55_05770 [Acidimicrobiia bacterium]
MDTKYLLRLGGAMVACAVIGWFPFVAGTRVPLLGLFDFGIHELGHLLFIWAGRTVHFLSGSVLQVAVPIGLTLAFLRWGNLPAAAVTTAWTGANLWDVSVYVADAPYERLVLWGGGQHDWATLLGGWDAIHLADEIAAVLSGLGGVLVVGAMALCALPAFAPGLRSAPAGADGA